MRIKTYHDYFYFIQLSPSKSNTFKIGISEIITKNQQTLGKINNKNFNIINNS